MISQMPRYKIQLIGRFSVRNAVSSGFLVSLVGKYSKTVFNNLQINEPGKIA